MSTPGYTVAQLRDALAFASTHPDGTLRIAWAPWPGTFTGTGSLRWFQQCLDRKINRPGARVERTKGYARTGSWRSGGSIVFIRPASSFTGYRLI